MIFVWSSMPRQRNSGGKFMKCFHFNNICLIGGYSMFFFVVFFHFEKHLFFLEINSAMTGFYDDVITTMLFRAGRVLIYCLKSFHMLHIFLLAVYTYAAGCCAIDQVQPSCLLNYQCNISSNHIFCEWPLKLYLWLGTSGIISIPKFSSWVSHRL